MVSDTQLDKTSANDNSSLVTSASDNMLISQRKTKSLGSRWRKKSANLVEKEQLNVKPVNSEHKVSKTVPSQISVSPDSKLLMSDNNESFNVTLELPDDGILASSPSSIAHSSVQDVTSTLNSPASSQIEGNTSQEEM